MANPTKRTIQILTDDSFNLSFAVPASLAQKLTRSSPPTTQEEDQVVESWEELEEETVETKLTQHLEKKRNAETLRTEQLPGPNITDPTSWLKDENEVADDFPIIVVNLTRLAREHGNYTHITSEVLENLAASLQEMILEDCTSLSEQLFDQKLAYHSTYGTYEAYLDGLEKDFPKDQFVVVDYPATIDKIPLHELLSTLRSPTKWRSINCLKELIAKSSRDIVWKANIISEIEKLAQDQHDTREGERQVQSSRLTKLTELRKSFRKKAQDKALDEENRARLKSHIEKLEKDILNLIEEMDKAERIKIDELSAPNALPADLSKMNLLDMIIAMILDRLPRQPQISEEDHYTKLLQHHQYICKLWKYDFGTLPRRQATTTVEENEDREPPMEATGDVDYDSLDENVSSVVEHKEEFADQLNEEEFLTDDDDDMDNNGSGTFACVGALASLQLSEDQERRGL